MAACSSNNKVNTRPKKQQTTLQTTCWTKPISLTKTMIYLQNYATHHVSVLILKTRHKTKPTDDKKFIALTKLSAI